MSEIIYGLHAIQALLDNAPERLLQVYVAKERQDHRLTLLLSQLDQLGITTQTVQREWLNKQTEGAAHQGVMAKIKKRKLLQENDLIDLVEHNSHPFLLFLDGITDPHNLGACLRSADAAGVHAVIVPKDRSADINATVMKVACGAVESVPLIKVTNLARTMRLLKDYGIWLVGTSGVGERTIFQSQLTNPLALVMGAEGDGLRRLTREHCDELVKIPMNGMVSSLNVSVATGICLFEVVRQREYCC